MLFFYKIKPNFSYTFKVSAEKIQMFKVIEQIKIEI